MVRGRQLYKCHACGKQFLGGNRIDAATLWREYTDLKQTYAQLAERYGYSPRTIKRKLDSYTHPQGIASPGRVVVVMDTTYWGRKYGVMLFKDAITGRDLLWYFVKNETNALYAQGIAELEEMGYEIPAVVFDGRKGLPKMFPDKKVQICQFHQQRTVRKYLTKHPKTEAAVELKEIADMLTRTDKESFYGMFAGWCAKWDEYLRERTIEQETGSSHYTHKRLRSAYLSIRRNLPLLFTWYDNIDMDIPNTTNLIDGHFSQLKRMLRNHNGMTRERRNKLVIGFFEASKGESR
ncbi:MAG: hypothetical protein IKO59_06605 [Bacteroidales bacterium]|nr:hypothetical protein [Bacteroidales bacterium]